MQKLFLPILLLALSVACNNNSSTGTNTAGSDTASVGSTSDPKNDWKLGIALWTFHTVNFPESLAKVDSSGLKYIEPNTFHKAGPELRDSLILQLSPAGIDKIKAWIARKGLICASIYIVGDSTIASWKKQFDIAKQLGVKFVTTEPPLNMWNSIDSLAGAYGIKVAIHEHWRGVSHYWNPADLGHWPKSGIDPLEAIKKLRGHIIAIHLKDIAAYDDPALRDVRVGSGVVKFPEIFAELKKQGFKGYIYIERDAEEQPSNLPSVIQEIRYYNDQVKKLE